MPKENFKRKVILELSFPEESGLVIKEILKKYGLEEKQKTGIRKWFKSKNQNERRKLFEELPGSKISQLVRDYAEGKINSVNINLLLTNKLDVSENKAEEIAQELKQKILSFIKPISRTQETLSPNKKNASKKIVTIKPKRAEAPQGNDIYRESVE